MTYRVAIIPVEGGGLALSTCLKIKVSSQNIWVDSSAWYATQNADELTLYLKLNYVISLISIRIKMYKMNF